MQAAQILAGYSLGQADLLRRAMGKKIRKEMEAQRKDFVTGAVERGIERAPGGCDLRRARTLRRIRLQQEPRRGLCAGRLPDRLSQGELSGRVPRRVDDARHGQYRQACRNSAPRRSASASRSSRRRSTARASRSRSKATPSITRWRALKGVGRQAVEAIVEARGDAAVRRSHRFRRAHQSARGQQAGAGEPRRRRRVRCAGSEPRARLRRGRHDARHGAAHP